MWTLLWWATMQLEARTQEHRRCGGRLGIDVTWEAAEARRVLAVAHAASHTPASTNTVRVTVAHLISSCPRPRLPQVPVRCTQPVIYHLYHAARTSLPETSRPCPHAIGCQRAPPLGRSAI